MNILVSNTQNPKKLDKILLTPDHIEILFQDHLIKIYQESNQLIIENPGSLSTKKLKKLHFWTDSRTKVKIFTD